MTCSFPSAGVAADQLQQERGFHMADFPAADLIQTWISGHLLGFLHLKK